MAERKTTQTRKRTTRRKPKINYENLVIERMKEMGTYRDSFIDTITVFAQMLEEHQKTYDLFIKSGSDIYITQKDAEGNPIKQIKNPLYDALEKQRRDFLKYANELGLTPVGAKKLDVLEIKKEESKLEKVLRLV